MCILRPILPILPALLTAVVLTACASSETTTDRASTDAVTPAPTAAAASPVNVRDRQRAEAWAKAVRGLSFDTGLVVVEQPPATIDRDAVTASMELGADHLRNNRKTRAVGAYTSAVRADPESVEAHLGLANAMLVKGKIDLAIAGYRTARQLDPASVDARFGLADMLAREQRRDEAITEMETVVRLAPDDARAHERLAIWQYYDGDYASAWKHVHAARALDHRLPPQFIVLLERHMPEPG
ncbi:MAG: tetratricopeptide repeat protein [Planctomycetes bacterium]|nr:tetratricopeptide repeat protein [Planctomycetota bacterium]